MSFILILMMHDEILPLQDYSEDSLGAAFNELEVALASEASRLSDIEQLESFKLSWTGRKQGRLTAVSQIWLKNAPASAKKNVGKRFAALKDRVAEEVSHALQRLVKSVYQSSSGVEQARFDNAVEELRQQELRRQIKKDTIDITLPGTRVPMGAEHPLIKTMYEMVAVFERMGYSVGVGPEVETDYYNFESLNFPPGHPARDTQDTLVLAGQGRKPLRERLLMRTHTSPVQIRTMEQQRPPVRIVIPGKVHRNDESDATHSPVFHQIEGLCVDEGITFGDLKGTLDHAMREFFGPNVKTRFFPSYFPFTEPSADVQISCPFCGGKGCRKCKQSGWIELLGCGMVDPAVFGFVRGKQAGYDPGKLSGFAFGMGVDRIAMMKYGISDIGLLYGGDVRFLEQFG